VATKAVSPEVGDEFSGEIKVAARVIDYLSSGLYQNAAACMKELVNNSYDADATEVKISVRPDADVISIEDNGTGMTFAQFKEHFERVAESHKRDDSQATERKRLKIGKIGIGFVAANEICDEMEIYSTCLGSEELLHVTIEFAEIRDANFPERRRAHGDVKKGDYHGELLTADKTESYTKIYLTKIRDRARQQFVKEGGLLDEKSIKSLYGKKADTVRETLSNLGAWDELDLYSRTRVRIGLNVPVEYLPEWYPPEYSGELDTFTRRAKSKKFSVIYDGTPLFKPTLLLDPRGRSKLRLLNFKGEHVQVKGYLFARHGAYKPRDLNGVLIRVREAAVGEYDSDFMGYPKQHSALFQDWTTSELYVDGALDEALNIDRRTFRDTHPAYVELQEWFLEELHTFWSEVRRDLYAAPSADRQVARASRERESISEVAKHVERTLGKSAAQVISSAWPAPEGAANDRQARREVRQLNKTYSVSEIYEIAVAVAEEILSKELARKYVAELTRRLRG
jgi:hypothetical protein